MKYYIYIGEDHVDLDLCCLRTLASVSVGSTLCLLLLTDGANGVKESHMAEAVAAHQGRPKAVATQLAAVAQGAESKEESVGPRHAAKPLRASQS